MRVQELRAGGGEARRVECEGDNEGIFAKLPINLRYQQNSYL